MQKSESKCLKLEPEKLSEHIQNELITKTISKWEEMRFSIYFRSYGLLVKKTNVFTLQPILSTFFKSPNLLKDLTLSHAEQVFVSDITYIKVDSGHAYLAPGNRCLLKKNMGWKLDDNMRVTLVKDARIWLYKKKLYS